MVTLLKNIKHTQNPTKEECQKLYTLQNVKRKLKNNNIIYVKANKGNGLVLIKIMNTSTKH